MEKKRKVVTNKPKVKSNSQKVEPKKGNNIKKKSGKKAKWEDIKRSKAMLIVALLVFVLLIYCIYKVVALIQNPADTFSVEQGKIYQEEAAIGYIIREETVVKGSNYKNGMVQIKTEGERVAKNEAIFRYYSSGEENLKKKIADLDSKIDEAIAGTDNLLNGNGDTRAIEKQIEEKLTLLMEESNLQTIREVKKEISNNITKKAKIAGDLSPSGSYLKKLIDERKKYENQLNEGTEHLKSPISGVVSYKVDGYEKVLSPDNLGNLTKETLENIDIKTGQVVADSSESGKIINNFKCYIACILNSEQAKQMEKGDSVKLRLPNNVEVSSTVENISNDGNDIVATLKLTEQVQELVSYRKISFDIIWWSYSGKKVPNTAIGTETKGKKQVSYVVRTRAGYQDKIWVKVMKQNEKYSIVENYTNVELQELGYSMEEIRNRKTLTLYDEILKNPIL